MTEHQDTTPPSERPQHVLIVDDDPDVSLLMTKVLERQGYCVSHSGSVESAIERLEKTRFDLVLLDLQLPDRHGQVLLRHLSKDGVSSIPVIIVTGTGTIEDAIEALRRRATDFLRKPFFPEELSAAVERAIKHARETNTKRPPVMSGGLLESEHLSPREREVLKHFETGKRVPEIARTLFVSPYTVRNHLKAIFKKTGVNSQTELMEKLLSARHRTDAD
jgi:DNA-binding NarL/FixJ family response regulator